MRRTWRRHTLIFVSVLLLLSGGVPTRASFHSPLPPVPIPRPRLASVTLSSPVTGSLLPTGERAEVSWTYDGAPGGFILEYEWEWEGTRRPVEHPNPCIAAPTIGYSWRVPAGVGRIRLHIKAVNGCTGQPMVMARDTTPWYTVPVPVVMLVQPNGGGTYVPGLRYDLRWRMSPGQTPYVNILYSGNGGASWSTIAAHVPNTGRYRWEIPEETRASLPLRGLIKVEALATYAGTEFPIVVSSGVSAPFTVAKDNSGIVLLDPDPLPGELVFTPSEEVIVRWQGAGSFRTVLAEYSADNGLTWSAIQCTTSKHVLWWVPAVETEFGRVRVRGYSESDCAGTVLEQDMSTHPFAIRSTSGNRAPVITGGGGASPEPGAMGYVNVVARDPDGDTLDYRWEQIEGPAATILSSTDNNALTYRAPAVTAPTNIVWEVTVSDAPTRGDQALPISFRIAQRIMRRPPRVDSISTRCGGVGTMVQIDGENLHDIQVWFNDRLAPQNARRIPTGFEGSRVVAYVPAGATTGPVVVRDLAGREATAASSFTVVPLEIDRVEVTQGIPEYPLIWSKQTLVQVYPRSGFLAACRAEVSSGTLTINGSPSPYLFYPQVGTGGVVLQPLPLRPRYRVSDGIHFRIPAGSLAFPVDDLRGFSIELTHNGQPVARTVVTRSAMPEFHDVTGGLRVMLIRMRVGGRTPDPDWGANLRQGQAAFMRAMPVPGIRRQVFPADASFQQLISRSISMSSDDLLHWSYSLADWGRWWNGSPERLRVDAVAGLLDQNSFAGGTTVGRAFTPGSHSLVLNYANMGPTLVQELAHNVGMVDISAPNHDFWNTHHSKYDEGTDCETALTFGQSLRDQLGRINYIIDMDGMRQYSTAPGASCGAQAKSIMSYAPNKSSSNTFLEYIDYVQLFRRAGGTASTERLATTGTASTKKLALATKAPIGTLDLNEPVNPPPPSKRPARDLIIIGSISTVGTVTVAASRLVAPGVPDPPDGKSPYSLVFLGPNNETLGNHPFPVAFDVEHHPDEKPPAVDHGMYSVQAPFPDAAVAVEIRYSEQTLRRLTLSTNAPVVKIASPAPGGHYGKEETLHLDWKGADADGDPLQYTVQLSRNGGKTWFPGAVMLTDTELDLEAQDLPGGSDIWLRVVASDGFHIGSANVGPIVVSDKPPSTPTLLEPLDGARFYADQAVTLVTLADDLEDGPLTGKSVVWTSSLTSVLGEGEHLSLPGLSPGTHSITVSVSDSAGQTASASVQVTVDDKDMPVHRPDAKGGPEKSRDS